MNMQFGAPNHSYVHSFHQSNAQNVTALSAGGLPGISSLLICAGAGAEFLSDRHLQRSVGQGMIGADHRIRRYYSPMSQPGSSAWRGWLRRALKILLIVEVVYLVLVNGLLQLQLTQDVVNMIRPDKFHVSWERAWSWYPFRVHARGIAANGQSRSQQWQLSTPAASGSISVLPLIFKRVWLSGVDVRDIDYRQRPRLKPDKDYSALLPYFPEIEGREIAPALTAPGGNKRPWRIAIDNARLTGTHSFWIFNVRGGGTGRVLADLTYQTRGGPFSLDGRKLDLQLAPLYLNGKREVFGRATLRGDLGFTPFVPRAHKDISLLQFLRLDAEIDLDANSLAFINVLTAGAGGAQVDGSGRVSGRLVSDRGQVLPGTGLTVQARDLAVRYAALTVAGEGAIGLVADAATPERIQLDFHYEDLAVRHESDDRPMLTGRDLHLIMRGSSRLNLGSDTVSDHAALGFNVEGLEVQDLALLQRYIPPRWPFTLYGGRGVLSGELLLRPTALRVDLGLESGDAQIGVRQYRFTTNLDAALKLDNPSILTEHTAIGGSYIRLGDAIVASGAEVQSNPWEASLEFTHGYLGLFSDEAKAAKTDVVDLLRLIGQSEAKQLLNDSYGVIGFQAQVSSLAWIGVLLGETHHTSIDGKGTVEGEIHLAGGWPGTGTRLEVVSPALEVGVLDYLSRGDGEITLDVQDGAESPDWLLTILLRDADMKRRDEAQSYIHNVDLALEALLEDMFPGRQERDFALRFRIESGEVEDMAVFNSYLPPDAPMTFTAGTADLKADILLLPEDARGWLSLVSQAVNAEVGEQSITGDLRADITLAGGTPRDMKFDITGSQVRLDNVAVAGERASFDGDYWSALISLTRAETTWTRPPQISADAALTISDTRPIVAMFGNQGYRPKWLSGMLTLENISGKARMDLADNTVIIPMARVISDKAELAAKARIAGESRDGVIYARYKKLDALLRITGGRKNLEVIKVREKFDNYVVPGP